MVGTLFLMIKFIFKQIETVHVGTEQHVLDPTHPYRPNIGPHINCSLISSL